MFSSLTDFSSVGFVEDIESVFQDYIKSRRDEIPNLPGNSTDKHRAQSYYFLGCNENSCRLVQISGPRTCP